MKHFAWALVLLLTTSAVAQNKLAVTKIHARRGVDAELAAVVEEYLVSKISDRGGFSVVGRDDINRMLDHEQQKQLSGCEEDSCLAEIGGALGVDRLVAGALDRVGGSILVSLKVIDVRTGEVVARQSERLRRATEEDALDAVSLLLKRLFQVPEDQSDLPTLAVTEIQARRGVDPILAQVVEEYLAGEINKTGVYKVVGRDDIARLMDHEQRKQLLGCDAESCLAEIGGALGAEKLVAGSMDKVGTSILVTLKVINVDAAKVERRSSERLRGATEEAALDAVAKLFKRLFYRELGITAASPSAGLPVTAPRPGAASAGTTSSGRVWTWVVTGVAAAALAAGVALEVVASLDRADLDDLEAEAREPNNTVTYSEIRDLQDGYDAKAVPGHVLLGVGGSLALTAILIYFLEAPATPAGSAAVATTPVLTPVTGPDHVGLVVGGRF